MVKETVLLFFIIIANFALATNYQVNPKPLQPVKDTRNQFSLSVIYSDKGYGISGGFHKPISRNSDLFFNFSITGISDTREFEYYDYYGNSYIQDKINRVFMIPVNIGFQHYLFKEELENDFKPMINFGVTPALVVTDPYDKGYFKAFGYSKAAFAMGGFAGVGMEFQQSKNLAFSLNFRYYYIPVLKGEVMSIKDNLMKDLGGMQLVFGINFLK